MAISLLDYICLVFGLIGGFVVGGVFWPLYRATRWKLRRMAEDQERRFRMEAQEFNLEYLRRDIKKRVRP